MIRVEFRHWKANSGYTHSETYDHIEENITAEEYVECLENPSDCFSVGQDAINVEMYDEDDNLLSEYFWEK